MKKILYSLALILGLAISGQAQTQILEQSTATQIQIVALSTSTGLSLLTTSSIPGGFTIALTKHADSGTPSVTTWTPTTFGTGTHDCWWPSAASKEWTCELTATDTDTVGRLELCWSYPSAADGCDRYTVVASASKDVNVDGDVASNTSVAAIKAQTDKLTYTASNEVSSNVTVMANNVIGAGQVAASALGTSEVPLLANLDAAVSTRGSYTVKRSTAKQWPMRFTIAGVPVTTGSSVTCTRSLDAPIASGGTGTTNTASTTTNLGFSEITLSTTDTNAADYMVLYCTAGGAEYTATFVVQQ